MINIAPLKDLLRIFPDDRTDEDLQEIARVLSDIEIFQPHALSPQFLSVCAHTFLMEFKQNDQIFKEGDEADNLYIILEGQIKILAKSKEGRETDNHLGIEFVREVARLGPGQFFGE